MLYETEVGSFPEEQKLRTIGFIKPYENVSSVKNHSTEYTRSGQVVFWFLEIFLTNGEKRKYVMKCPVDTFGAEAIEYFVDRRVELSRILRDASIKVPRVEKYDKGTSVEDYVPGDDLKKVLKRATEEDKILYQKKREEFIRKIEGLNLRLMDDHDDNWRVTPEGEIYLIDLDLNYIRTTEMSI